MTKLVLEDETYAIRGAAIEVHKQLGSGFLEAVYQEAMEIELSIRAVPFEAQKGLKIFYKDQELKKRYVPDLICFGQVVVELKAIKQITDEDRAQLLNYLNATGMKVGLIINFGSKGLLEIDRRAL